MNGKSLDIKKEKIDLLKEIMPEVFTEGDKIDIEKLKLTLDEDVNISNERYVLNWAGKSEAYKVLQTPTMATLAPAKEESINFDTTENIFIEGENLKVLKVLQKSYYGKIKMIYIDPPYNTGNDSFIYPDKFSETKEEYLKRIGEKDEEGYLLKEGLFRKNSKENGQYHSNWLNMMYPRLFLAKNLLQDDGVIFISIDDNEVHNLRMIMNEIFGEENFEGHIHWRRRHNQPNDKTKMIGIVAEHILSYSKNSEFYKKSGVGKIDLTGTFSNPDGDSRGEWASKPWKVGSDQSGTFYTIQSPTGRIFEEEWMGEEKTFSELLEDNRIIFPKKGDGLPRKKYFKFEREEEGQCATNWWKHEDFGNNQEANDEMTELFGIKNIFSNPKPVRLIKGLIQISNLKDKDIVLDFFAGSGTTAHAIYNLNIEDGINRRFILTQFEDKTEEDTEAYKAGYKTIAEIGKERIRRVIKKNNEEKDSKPELFEGKEIDLGFKVFKLKYSNFKLWRGDVIENGEDLSKQMEVFENPVKEGTEEENILYELILKSGYELTTKIEKKDEVYSIDSDKLVIVLSKVDDNIIKTILKIKPRKCIILDNLFNGNDKLKTNTVLQMKDAGVEFKTV